jgi:hypothetical protein
MIFTGETLYNNIMSSAEEIEKIERALRAGLLEDSQKSLKKLEPNNSERIRAAALARRAYLPLLSIKWLFPLVYPDGILDRGCSGNVLLEYGASLIFAGALVEGRQILEIALEKKESQALLHLAFSHIREWDFEKSSTLLRKFLAEEEIDPHSKIIAKVNLLTSLVKTKPESAECPELSTELLGITKTDHKRLYLNTLELTSQLHIARKEYSRAKEVLKEISAHVPNDKSPEYLSWMRGSLIVEHSMGKVTNADSLRKLIHLAKSFSHAETLRDAHLRMALYEKDKLLFEHVHRGTPYLAFRLQAEKEFKQAFGYEPVLSEQHFVLREKQQFKALQAIPPLTSALNLSTGFYLYKGSWQPEFKTQFLPFRLLQVICDDYYQNKNIVELSAQLHPENNFHPIHSIQSVFQLIKRMNEAFVEIGIVARIENDKGRYTLNALNLALTKGNQSSSFMREEWDLLKTFSDYRGKHFTRRELEDLTQIAPRTLSRYLEKLVKEHELIVVGKGPNTRYSANPEKKVA